MIRSRGRGPQEEQLASPVMASRAANECGYSAGTQGAVQSGSAASPGRREAAALLTSVWALIGSFLGSCGPPRSVGMSARSNGPSV